jgi:hypothetical protein
MLSQSHAGLSDPDQLLLQDLSDRGTADGGQHGEAAGAVAQAVASGAVVQLEQVQCLPK